MVALFEWPEGQPGLILDVTGGTSCYPDERYVTSARELEGSASKWPGVPAPLYLVPTPLILLPSAQGPSPLLSAQFPFLSFARCLCPDPLVHPPPPSGAVAAAGATLLSAQFPRWFVDLNRAPDDVDPGMLDLTAGLPSGLALNPGPKSKLGVGLVRR
jgi:hypothetical protein